MIDTETGFETEPICECSKCEQCAGEGVVREYEPVEATSHSGMVVTNQDTGQDMKCFRCDGTGRNSSQCEIDHDIFSGRIT
jgi:DnaJ-class molecular chaperone